MIKTPPIFKDIAKQLYKEGATTLLVGGCVRDHFLNIKSKDYDIEVYNLTSLKKLEDILTNYGKVNLVGKSFGVLKLYYNNQLYDFSFPRVENKTAKGHKGFDIKIYNSLKYEEAFKRRDFSINALGYNIIQNTIIDPFYGLKDIKNKVLKHINDQTFTEDPLRVYRAIQFCARFEFKLEKTTKQLCKKMVKNDMLDELPKERIYEEIKKLLLKSPKPSIGFELMRELGILEKYFRQLYKIINIPQPYHRHPEGDVWKHTMLSIDKMANLLYDTQYTNRHKLKLMFAILCHDLGKATHTIIKDKNNSTIPFKIHHITNQQNLTITSYGHEQAGITPAKELLYNLTNEHSFIKSILPLIEYHTIPSIFYTKKASDSDIRYLSTKVNIKDLILVAKANFLGTTTQQALEGIYVAEEWLVKQATRLKVLDKPPIPIIQGKDLIKLGLQPSYKFKDMLDDIYDKQLKGILTNKQNAIIYIQTKFKS